MGWKRAIRNLKRGLKLKAFLDKAVKDKKYFPNIKKKKTYCNQWCLVYLKLFGYDISSILWHDEEISNTNTWRSFGKAIENKVLQIDPIEAQKRANRGEMVYVLSRKGEPSNHAAIVYPTFLPYNKEKGVRISQTGGKPGTWWISEWQAWGDMWQHAGIKYFVLEKLK